MYRIFIFFFFFSSRRRHTRFDCDWSSDVCSSDLVYGALLTPKGMIVVDGWAARLGATVSYTVPAHGGGRERALAIFTRSVPPRLARVSDRTSEVAVYRLAGPGALAVAVAAGLEVPAAAGRVLPRPP